MDSTDHGVSGPPDRRALVRLSLGALGVVFGDIGTSPLYTLKECFAPAHGIGPDRAGVLGVLSLVFWALTVIVVVKYIGFVMRADNHGEGGILALLSLLSDPRGDNPLAPGERGHKRRYALISLGIFGAALLFADGIITPAISVLGALEGIEITYPGVRGMEVPLAVVILATLFAIQRRGTASIGRVFGPLMAVWFFTLAALGIPWIVREPQVLAALSPFEAWRFALARGPQAFFLLGSVVLCVTGAEALYADMGHFGRVPIRIAWMGLVFPALLLNYFGQGAMLLELGTTGAGNPFFEMAPALLRLPLVALATAAAIIASQALISGAFSLAQQAVNLGLSPRLKIVHTSADMQGQIFVPAINGVLMAGCLTLVVVFRNTANLAAAYGIAVMATMIITTLLLYSVERQLWKWRLGAALALGGFFLVVEVPFLAANVVKVVQGGWFPLSVAAVMVVLMTTWKRGRKLLAARLEEGGVVPIEQFLAGLDARPLSRVPGTAVFLVSKSGGTPILLLHHVKHNHVLHERLLLLTVLPAPMPQVSPRERVKVRELGRGFYELVVTFGFMEAMDVPAAIEQAVRVGLLPAQGAVSYFLGRETLLVSRKPGLAGWRKWLFIVMARNSRSAASFFQLPPNRVVELGAQVEL